MTNKNILFLVTGMTPQIITETVWALACDPANDARWIPDEIHAMSTEDGLNQIRKRLFEDGMFAQMQQDYPQLAHVEFNTTHLHEISNAEGQILNDLKDPNDNELAADAICAAIRKFTEQAHSNLYVSIAGGRKTMGFYAGYALSLYGRSQDRLTHVLVDDKFESVNDFFYPTPATRFVTNRDGKVLDARDARIWLASIPFVRMQYAIKDKHQLKQNKDSFSQVVSKINASFNDVRITLRLYDKTVVVNDEFEITDLPPREFAMLHWFLDNRKQGKDGIIAPTKKMSSKDTSAADVKYIGELTEDFKRYYQVFKFDMEDIQLDVDKVFFETVKSHLLSALKEALGFELAGKIMSTAKRGKPYSLNLAAEAIEIVEHI